MKVFSPADFGGLVDGDAVETDALQAAIDACSDAGGGTVVVPPGVHHTGTLYLKSHVELHLQPGAVLRGVDSRDAYNPDDVFPENEVFARENATGAHLIIAYRAENVSITGTGTIDGNGQAFFGEIPTSERVGSYRFKRRNFPITDWRPSQMVFFCRCRNVVVRDVSLLNAPYWTCFLLACEDVRISGVRIENPPETPNGDGIDIDCSRNVTVSDCILRCGDDCITLRGNQRPLGGEAGICENVVVTNCVLSSPCNAIRVGVGDGIVRDCLLSNIVIQDSRTGINMVSRYGNIFSGGTQIERIRFANFRLDTILPLHMVVGRGALSPVGIRDIDFSGFSVDAEAGSHVGGEIGCPAERVRFTDWDLRLHAGTDCVDYVDAVPDPIPLFGAPGIEGKPGLPAGIFARHGTDFAFRNIRIRWGEELGAVWHYALHLEDIDGVEVRDVHAPAPGGHGEGIRRV